MIYFFILFIVVGFLFYCQLDSERKESIIKVKKEIKEKEDKLKEANEYFDNEVKDTIYGTAWDWEYFDRPSDDEILKFANALIGTTQTITEGLSQYEIRVNKLYSYQFMTSHNLKYKFIAKFNVDKKLISKIDIQDASVYIKKC